MSLGPLGRLRGDQVGLFDDFAGFGWDVEAQVEAKLDHVGDIFGTLWKIFKLLRRSWKEVRFQDAFDAIWEPLGGAKTSISLQRGCQNQV